MTQLCWEECEEDAAEKTMTKLGLSEKFKQRLSVNSKNDPAHCF